jgi:hypothetical protein
MDLQFLSEASKDSPEFRASLQRTEDAFEDCLRLQEAAIRLLRTFLEDLASTSFILIRIELSEQLPRLGKAIQSVVSHSYLNIPQPVYRLLEMLTDMFSESEYKLLNLLLKDFGSKILYPMLQHSEQTKRLRVSRRSFEKTQERFENSLNRHSMGKDELVFIKKFMDHFRIQISSTKLEIHTFRV